MMYRESVLGERIYLIREFLAPAECERFMAETEARGYGEAPVNTRYGPMVRQSVRSNSRVIFDDAALAAEWFERARAYLPVRLGEWEACGMNERFRAYRYEPGELFARHYDASYERSPRESSQLSFIVYLNDDFEGGSTGFYHSDDRPRVAVRPRAGTALVFDHYELHDGAPVVSGRKYVLRTDVMYHRVG